MKAQYTKNWNPASADFGENPAVIRGRQRAMQAFDAAPERRHVVTTTTGADYLLCLLAEMPPAFLDWGIGQALKAVAFLAVCRRHDGGSFTRRMIPVFRENVPALAGDLLIDEERAADVFGDLGRWSAAYSGNVPADVVGVD